MKTKLRKIETITMTVVLSLALLTSIVPMFALTEAADSSSIPTSFMEFSNAYAVAVVNIPSTGNITKMTIAAMHQDKSSTIDNYEVLALTLSSSLTTGTAAASIVTNFNAEDTNWRKALRNGTKMYTEVNGAVTINNLFRVTGNELRVIKVGNRVTVDFEPKTTIAITLPRDTFPAANFSATWTVPSFHVDIDINGTATTGNSTSTNPSGWSENNEYTSYDANYTFTSSTLSSYRTSGTGSIRTFNAHRGQASGNLVFTPDVMKTLDLYNFGQAVFNISNATGAGGIKQMQINALHAIAGPQGTPNVMQVNITAPGFGWVQGGISTQQDLNARNWVKTWANGSTAYTEVNGNVTINNLFNLSPSELKIDYTATRLTVVYNPVAPVTFTLPPSAFPPANFSSTWTLPAFNVTFNWALIPNVSYMILGNSLGYPSGWRQTNDFVLGYSGAILTVPAWNLTTSVSGSTTFMFPYMVTSLQAPSLPKQPAATAFTSVSVLPGWTWNFFAHSNQGVAPYSYQWYEGTTLLQGQTSMVLPVTKNAPGRYTFYCKVIDSQGTTANSNSVTLRVLG